MAKYKYAGVDMSYHQSPSCIDYKKLKKAKIDGKVIKFAMLRFSYGKSKDTAFDTHYKGCKDAKIYVGVYHWLRATTPSEARLEAQWLVDNLKKYTIDYPVTLDFEDADLLAKKYSKEQYTAIVDAFMSVLIAANYYVLLYTNPNCLKNVLLPRVQDDYDIWLAHWTTKPADYGQTMWQYTALGTATEVDKGWALTVGNVDGVGCPIDVNWCYVGYAAKIKKLGKNKPITKYRVTATKTVSEGTVENEKKQLGSMGYVVKTEKI